MTNLILTFGNYADVPETLKPCLWRGEGSQLFADFYFSQGSWP